MVDITKKSSSDNYYRILGTNSNADDDLIKKRYLEKVRAFPPEKDPEEFKRIREAYDTLKDPFERSMYDLETKYQGKGGRLLKEAILYIDHGLFSQARERLEQAQDIAVDNLYILKIWADLALMENDLVEFNEIFSEIKEIAPANKLFFILMNKASMLIEADRPGETLKIVKKMETLFPERADDLTDLYLTIYDKEENFNKIWQVLLNRLNKLEEVNEDSIRVFTNTIALINKYEQWAKKDTFIKLTDTFINKIDPDDEVYDYLLYWLEEHFLEAEEYSPISSQLFYSDLILLFDSESPYIKKKKKLQLAEKLEQKIDQMAEDDSISSYVFYKAAEWFFDWLYPGEEPENFIDLPSRVEMKRYQDEKAANYSSILVLEKKYPDIYQKFRDKWQKIKRESREALNNRQLSLFEKQINTGQDSDYEMMDSGQIINTQNVGRNDPCPCGSGKKYKKCCGR